MKDFDILKDIDADIFKTNSVDILLSEKEEYEELKAWRESSEYAEFLEWRKLCNQSDVSEVYLGEISDAYRKKVRLLMQGRLAEGYFQELSISLNSDNLSKTISMEIIIPY
jgi:hypothetical protein